MVDRTFSRPFCPNLRFCFSSCPHARAPGVGDDLNVILFEFLDDDMKPAQRWYTVVPELSDALVAQECRREKKQAHARDIPTVGSGARNQPFEAFSTFLATWTKESSTCASFSENALICARQTADRDLESVSAMKKKGECLDRSTTDNRP